MRRSCLVRARLAILCLSGACARKTITPVCGDQVPILSRVDRMLPCIHRNLGLSDSMRASGTVCAYSCCRNMPARCALMPLILAHSLSLKHTHTLSLVSVSWLFELIARLWCPLAPWRLYPVVAALRRKRTVFTARPLQLDNKDLVSRLTLQRTEVCCPRRSEMLQTSTCA